MLTLAHEVDRRGWWQRTKPTFDERVRTLLNLKKKADLIVNYECTNVPGLIQIPGYTRALMIECEMVPADEVESHMTTRMQSHSVLDGPKPPGCSH